VGQTKPPLRTIEDIERRAAEIRVEERRALATLVVCMREIAVRCPIESRLPMQLAEAAKSLSCYASRQLEGEEDAVRAIATTVGECGELGRMIKASMPLVDKEAGAPAA
jgi:hypothetical protein